MRTKTAWLAIDAPANFDAGGQGSEFGCDLRVAVAQAMTLAHQIGIEHCAEISDAAFAHAARNHRRLAVEPAVRLAVAEQNLDVRRRSSKAARPRAKRSRTRAFRRSARRRFERVILLHAPAKRCDERAGLALDIQRVVLILHAGARPEQRDGRPAARRRASARRDLCEMTFRLGAKTSL